MFGDVFRGRVRRIGRQREPRATGGRTRSSFFSVSWETRSQRERVVQVSEDAHDHRACAWHGAQWQSGSLAPDGILH
jgi:hypothetical protein